MGGGLGYPGGYIPYPPTATSAVSMHPAGMLFLFCVAKTNVM